MEWLKWPLRGLGFLLAGSLGLMGAWAAEDNMDAYSLPNQISELFMVVETKQSACTLEAYAYLRVAGIARELGTGSDVLAEALEDLRDQLGDCLGASDPSDSTMLQDRRREAALLSSIGRLQTG